MAEGKKKRKRQKRSLARKASKQKRVVKRKSVSKKKPVVTKAVGLQVLTGVTPRWELEK